MAARSICFYTAGREGDRNLLPEKSLIPSRAERKMLAAVKRGRQLTCLPRFTEGVSDVAPCPATAANYPVNTGGKPPLPV